MKRGEHYFLADLQRIGPPFVPGLRGLVPATNVADDDTAHFFHNRPLSSSVMNLIAWRQCVRLSRPLVSFRTHFKSLHFHFISFQDRCFFCRIFEFYIPSSAWFCHYIGLGFRIFFTFSGKIFCA